jgi:hypothetical protein
MKTSTTSESRTRRTLGAVRDVLSDLDYANRRSLELRTGVPFLKQAERPAGIPLRLSEMEFITDPEDPRLTEI